MNKKRKLTIFFSAVCCRFRPLFASECATTAGRTPIHAAWSPMPGHHAGPLFCGELIRNPPVFVLVDQRRAPPSASPQAQCVAVNIPPRAPRRAVFFAHPLMTFPSVVALQRFLSNPEYTALGIACCRGQRHDTSPYSRESVSPGVAYNAANSPAPRLPHLLARNTRLTFG